MSQNLRLRPGVNIRTVITNRRATDNFGQPIRYVVEHTLFGTTP